jgi:hypothetical protein
MLKRLRTWHVEQAVLFVLITLATWAQLRLLQAKGAIGVQTVVPLVISAFATLVAQKVRSAADRQAEEDLLRGIEPTKIECAKAQAFWGMVLQALMLFMGIALAPTLWNLPVAIYATFYSVRLRPLYRRWVRPWWRRLRGL